MDQEKHQAMAGAADAAAGGGSVAKDTGDDFEFCVLSSGGLVSAGAGAAAADMCVADEVFSQGKLLPLRLSSAAAGDAAGLGVLPRSESVASTVGFGSRSDSRSASSSGSSSGCVSRSESSRAPPPTTCRASAAAAAAAAAAVSVEQPVLRAPEPVAAAAHLAAARSTGRLPAAAGHRVGHLPPRRRRRPGRVPSTLHRFQERRRRSKSRQQQERTVRAGEHRRRQEASGGGSLRRQLRVQVLPRRGGASHLAGGGEEDQGQEQEQGRRQESSECSSQQDPGLVRGTNHHQEVVNLSRKRSCNFFFSELLCDQGNIIILVLKFRSLEFHSSD